ncbi:hypothetical protein ABZ502_32605 [Streptomyces abikoensis]|uniref:hypothetical protein n=1 Tax=Streptomyces abikoensis TaxID=97398 RepID=UPI0033EA835E
MSIDYWAVGTLDITPPVPLAALRELLDSPYAPLAIAPKGTTEDEAKKMDGEWFAVAADDAGTDDQGHPTTIGAVIVNHDGRSFTALERLRRLAACCAADTEFDGEVLLEGEAGDTGFIAQTEEGDLYLWWD